MADRDRPIQAQIHPQHRFDQVVRGGGGKNYQSGGGPSTSQILAALTLLPLGGTLLALSGLTLTGTVIGLTVATPLFVIFSPVLVPAAITITLAVIGFLSSGALGVIGLSSLSYVFKRLRPSSGGEQVDMDWAKRGMQDMVGYVGQKTKEAGQNIENNYKTHDQGVRA
ncbi:Oleosin 16.4 kDa [Hibiscus syriacus]|uniref:Oleosin n=1 Tax=Hibiscus syriacus TaxID=106335 RepID=A0A6A2ZYM4_HIBSY|nr:oleosin 16.4 kDa-like [Hibiscus syriacus]KAE8697141.1 Oleosin 16.4 kDa [Hibiscus syriacus]